jgi:hypothetical protein
MSPHLVARLSRCALKIMVKYHNSMAEFSGTTQSLCQSLSEKFSENERKMEVPGSFSL